MSEAPEDDEPVAMQRPKPGWSPLWLAPIRAICRHYRSALEKQIFALANAPPHLRCIEWGGGSFEYDVEIEDSDGEFYPHRTWQHPLQTIELLKQGTGPNPDALDLTFYSEAWDWLVAFMQDGIAIRNIEVFARADTPTAVKFSFIPPDVWSHFAIEDWMKGVAKAPAGERLYSIHMVSTVPPEGKDQVSTILPPPDVAIAGGKPAKASDYLLTIALKEGAGLLGSRMTGKELLRKAMEAQPGFYASERTAQDVLRRIRAGRDGAQ